MTNNELERQKQLRALVRRAIERRKQVLVYEIARRCEALMSSKSFQGRGATHEPGSEWERIESLSKLRALVGGRFQNLKDRWVRAGFPLREHRGDRTGQKKIDHNGWIELASWINKQGFELRLADENEPWLFELRKLP